MRGLSCTRVDSPSRHRRTPCGADFSDACRDHEGSVNARLGYGMLALVPSGARLAEEHPPYGFEMSLPVASNQRTG